MRIAAIDRELVRCRLELDRQWLREGGMDGTPPPGAPAPHVHNIGSMHGMAEKLKEMVGAVAQVQRGGLTFQWRDCSGRGRDSEKWVLDMYDAGSIKLEGVAVVYSSMHFMYVCLPALGFDYTREGGGDLELRMQRGRTETHVKYSEEHGEFLVVERSSHNMVQFVESFLDTSWVPFQRCFQVGGELLASVFDAAHARFPNGEFGWNSRGGGDVFVRWTVCGSTDRGLVRAILRVSAYSDHCAVGLSLHVGHERASRAYAGVQLGLNFQFPAIFSVQSAETNVADINALLGQFKNFVLTTPGWRLEAGEGDD